MTRKTVIKELNDLADKYLYQINPEKNSNAEIEKTMNKLKFTIEILSDELEFNDETYLKL